MKSNYFDSFVLILILITFNQIFSQSKSEYVFETQFNEYNIMLKYSLEYDATESKSILFINQITVNSSSNVDIESNKIELLNQFVDNSLYNYIGKKFNDLQGNKEQKSLEVVSYIYWNVKRNNELNTYEFNVCTDSKKYKRFFDIVLVNNKYQITDRKYIIDENLNYSPSKKFNCFAIF